MFTAVTYMDRAECLASLPTDCTATVGAVEGCVLKVLSDQCNYAATMSAEYQNVLLLFCF